MAAGRRLQAVPDTGVVRKAGLYVRVSLLAGRDGERFHSPDMQLSAMRELCLRQGWEETEVWTDLDRTGRDFSREGIQAAIAAVDRGEVDVLAVYDCSRLGRNTGESLQVIRQLRDAGAIFASVSEQIDDSPAGQLALTMFLGLAQHYSDTMGVRWKDVHRRVHEQGRIHGPCPIGYKREGGGRIAPDPVMAPLVVQAFRDYVAGVPIAQLVDGLSEARGRYFDRNSVRRMLQNPIYIGRVRLNGLEVEGQHQRLIDDEMFEAASRGLRRNRSEPRRRISASWSLSGIAVCGLCEKPLVKQYDAKRRISRVHCGRGRDLKASTCEGIGWPMVEAVEAAVLEGIKTWVKDLRRSSTAQVAKDSRRTEARAAERRLRRRLDALGRGRRQVLSDWAMRAETGMTRAEYVDSLSELDSQLKAVRAQLAAVGDVSSSPESKQTAAAAQRLLKLWPELSPDERRGSVRTLISRVKIGPPEKRWAAAVNDMAGRVEIDFL